MSAASSVNHILLATDLGPRSDRALDRSFYLAHEWGARLTLAHAVEFDNEHKDVPSWRRGPDKATILKDRLVACFEEEGRTVPQIVIETGKPDRVTLDTAKSVNADLIVTGVAKVEPLGRKVLGDTVATLVRKADCSVLTVKKRLPRGYRRIAVGLDMSDFSKKALLFALENFPEAKISAVHAVSIPLRGRAGDPETYAKALCDEARTECGRYLDDNLSAEQRARIDLVVDEGGSPGWLMAVYADDTDTDLVVIGTHGAGGLLDVLLGSAAIGILEAVPCDVLVVR